MTKRVFIASAKRTPIGSFLGTLKDVSASELGAVVIKAVLEDTKIDPSLIDEVIVGNILPAGQGQGIARQCSIKGGVPNTVPAYSINIACGSGMKAVMLAYANIQQGYHMILAGGTESMSQCPFLLPKQARNGIKMGNITMKDHMIDDALNDAFHGIHMGVTAENIATKYNISRERQDQFAILSQTKAIKAQDEGLFVDEIVPVEVKVGKEVVLIKDDEYPNRKTSLDKLASLRPAFVKEGSVTAGNASGINDGASMMLVVDEESLKKYNLTPLVEIIGFGQGGVDPLIMGLGPTPAIKQALAHSNMSISDIDVFELNEAFAAQAIGVVHELGQLFNVSEEEILGKTNPKGGAIALGHPVGASGNRILTTLIYDLHHMDKSIGCASLCIGGGMGTAIIVKSMKGVTV
ncbi:MAG: acetyl-CoA C-acetyltransferase [Erysipelothrix sp.]|jgi:acetyl-CoA C-acetyltransferase|nr:acetyl-CoA C-acetyltransferase [Erysipelothrix sp.]